MRILRAHCTAQARGTLIVFHVSSRCADRPVQRADDQRLVQATKSTRRHAWGSLNEPQRSNSTSVVYLDARPFAGNIGFRRGLNTTAQSRLEVVPQASCRHCNDGSCRLEACGTSDLALWG